MVDNKIDPLLEAPSEPAILPSSSRVMQPARLAIDGGSPVNRTPFAPWPSFDEEQIEASTSVLRSGKVNYWTGDEGREFEREFAAYTGTRHAVAVANGTVALELALLALGIGPGDEVITSSRTFIASASCAVARGALPVMADVSRDSQNITADTVRQHINANTRAIIAVHLAGWPCDMNDLLNIAREYNLHLIEDCAQAHGARYKGRAVGSFGSINAFSFCQDKIMTTGGEGGIVTTDSDELWEKAWSYKDHGKSYAAVHRPGHPPGFRWLHTSFGTNWRLTEMQSALGRAQLRTLDAQVEKRRRLARRLDDAFNQIPALRVPAPPPHIHHSFYKYYVFLRPERLREGWIRDRVLSAIAAEGVPCFSGSCSEIYLEQAFNNIRPSQRLTNARELGETSLMFLVHPTLDEEHMDITAEAVRKVLDHATA